MKTKLYTFCYNERTILPFVVEYWKRFADDVKVFDNGSTDGSIDYLKNCGIDVQVEEYISKGGQDNFVMQDIKNTCWKEARKNYDLVVVCDMDELLCAPNIYLSLCRMWSSGATVNIPNWYDFITDEQPEPRPGQMLHTYSPLAVRCPNPKVLLFNPNKIEEMNYSVGAHSCDPEGIVKLCQSDISVLHLNNNLSLDYKVDRYAMLNTRRSPQDIRAHHGVHYEQSSEELARAYDIELSQAINFGELMR